MGFVVAALRRIWLPALICAAALAGFWLLAVSPRLDNAKLKADAQQVTIDTLNRNVALLQTSKKEQDKLNAATADEMGRLSGLRATSDRQTIVIREAVDRASLTAGPQAIGGASRAYFDAVIAERAAGDGK